MDEQDPELGVVPDGGAARWADVDCPLCASDAPIELFRKSGYRYVRCAACGLVYVTPRLADRVAANQPMSDPRAEYETPGATGDLRSRDRKYGRRLRELARHRGDGRLLEIGCREGHFLDVARRLGWDAQGVEPEDASACVARERFGLTVHVGYLEDVGLPTQRFDVVYLCEVLEHVESPLPLFREIRRVLRPGGVVWCKTGNVDSYSATRLGAQWSYFAYRRLGHVTYFSPRTIRRLCSDTGLDVVALRTWGVEMPRGVRRRLLGAMVRAQGRGAHMELLARRV